jgi:putative RNA 2'-phosphotransferase
MNEPDCIRLSTFFSKHLRHVPLTIGLSLEVGGWVPIDDLLTAASRAGFACSHEELDFVGYACDQQRFAIDDTGTRIRANQGHSTPVDLQLSAEEPPRELYHGSPARNVKVILREGLLRMSRQNVHLSADIPAARRVGARHGLPVVFVVDAAGLNMERMALFHSANGVWLVDLVPPEYLRVLSSEN